MARMNGPGDSLFDSLCYWIIKILRDRNNDRIEGEYENFLEVWIRNEERGL